MLCATCSNSRSNVFGRALSRRGGEASVSKYLINSQPCFAHVHRRMSCRAACVLYLLKTLCVVSFLFQKYDPLLHFCPGQPYAEITLVPKAQFCRKVFSCIRRWLVVLLVPDEIWTFEFHSNKSTHFCDNLLNIAPKRVRSPSSACKNHCRTTVGGLQRLDWASPIDHKYLSLTN